MGRIQSSVIIGVENDNLNGVISAILFLEILDEYFLGIRMKICALLSKELTFQVNGN